MKSYAVVDTNVILSGLWSRNRQSPPVAILQEIVGGRVIPLYCEAIFLEYDDVLHRPKFHLPEPAIATVFRAIRKYGISVEPVATDEQFPDPDDRIFFETALAWQGHQAYLVTGNTRHFPQKPFVVTPAEMVAILGVHE
ncbi:MAG: putative toxin-antitoxin system toxin component, PIN family [Schwartzia sp.]|nr:putative toxin-antitoxin system toxin component, PIN family [Schwartzia sp. (in: firmicutes)]